MRFLRKLCRWDVASLSLVLATSLLLIYRWDMFPKFLDIYYHASVAKGFELAKGVVLQDFWEYAPSGRPHLYPPLFHLLLLLFLKLGISLSFTLKFFGAAVFPLLQIASWGILRKLFNEKTAFFSLLLFSSSYWFFWFQVNMVPASLVIVFTLLSFYFVEKGRFLGAALTLTLALYTHLGLSLATLLSLIVYAVLRRERFFLVVKSVFLALAFFSPWLIHTLRNLSFLNPGGPPDFIQLRLHLLLLALAVCGFYVCFRQKKRFLLPLSYGIAMLPFLYFYPSIYFNGHTLFSWSMLGGVFLGNVRRPFLRHYKFFFVLLFIAALLVTPIVTLPKQQGEIVSFHFERGTLAKLVSYKPEFEDINILTPVNLELSSYVASLTGPNGIFYVQNAYLGGLITAFTGVSQAGAMYHEVLPYLPENADAASVFIREPHDKFPPKGYVLARKIGSYEIFVSGSGKSPSLIPQLKIHIVLAYSLLLAALAFLFVEFRKSAAKKLLP